MPYRIQIDDEIRLATPDEIARIEQVQNESAILHAEKQKLIAAKITARAKLKTLGLTDDEIAALVG